MPPSEIQSSKVAPIRPDQQHVLNIEGFIRTITEAPTAKPRKFSEQIYIVRAGGSTALYLYDTVTLAWNYTTLT